MRDRGSAHPKAASESCAPVRPESVTVEPGVMSADAAFAFRVQGFSGLRVPGFGFWVELFALVSGSGLRVQGLGW